MGNARRAASWVIPSKDLLETLGLLEEFGRTYLDVHADLPRHDYTVFTPSSNNLHDTPDLDRAIARLGEPPHSVQINFKRPPDDPSGLIREVEYNAHAIHVKKLVTIELVVLGDDCEPMDQFFSRARDALASFITEHWPETVEEFEARRLGGVPSPALPSPREAPSTSTKEPRIAASKAAPVSIGGVRASLDENTASAADPTAKWWRRWWQKLDPVMRHPLWSALIVGLIILVPTILFT